MFSLFLFVYGNAKNRIYAIVIFCVYFKYMHEYTRAYTRRIPLVLQKQFRMVYVSNILNSITCAYGRILKYTTVLAMLGSSTTVHMYTRSCVYMCVCTLGIHLELTSTYMYMCVCARFCVTCYCDMCAYAHVYMYITHTC